MSHLLQMRGLKPKRAKGNLVERQSHLLQMRGLKQILAGLKSLNRSHLLQMRGLKPVLRPILLSTWLGRIFYRCVD